MSKSRPGPDASRPFRTSFALVVVTALALVLTGLERMPATADPTQPPSLAQPATLVPAGDPMGSPSRYTVAAADDVFVTNQQASGQTVKTTRARATTDATMSTITQSTTAPDAPSDLSANPSLREVSGRFDDPLHDHVLSMRMVDADALTFLVNTYDENAQATADSLALPVPTGGLDNPFAVAAGDLDRVVDGDEFFHDEAAIGYLGSDGRLTIRVIDFARTPGQWTQTTATGTLPTLATQTGPGSVNLEIADLNGDGTNELAAVWQGADNSSHLTVLTYTTTDGNGSPVPPTLSVKVPDVSLAIANPGWGVLAAAGLQDTAVGDFDGSGREGLAVAMAATYPNPVQTAPFVAVFGFDDEFAVRASGLQAPAMNFTGIIATTQPPTDNTWTRRGLVLEPGLFRYDGSTHSISRRQLALAFPGTPVETGSGTRGSVVVTAFGVDPPSKTDCSPCEYEIGQQTRNLNVAIGGDPTMPYTMTAGGFGGLGQPADVPEWGVAVAAVGNQGVGGVSFIRIPNGGTPSVASTTSLGFTGGTFHVTAYDAGGRSLTLGVPVRFTVDSLQTVNLVAHEPPKHADWQDGAFVNVSRTPDFKITLGNSKSELMSSTTTTKTDHTIGGSQEEKASATVKAGLFGLASQGASADVALKVSGSTAERLTASNTNSTDITMAATAATVDDDLVGAYYQTIYVFRYPILGRKLADGSGLPIPPCTADCQGYLEIQVPVDVSPIEGSGASSVTVPGKSLPWYQPTHQNGNALSYPLLDGTLVDTPDLGTYSYVDANKQTQTVRAALLNQPTTLGGTEDTLDLDFSRAAGASSERSTTQKLSENVDAHVGIKTKIDIGAVQAKLGLDSTTTFDNEQSWGTLTTGETVATATSKFELDVPQFTDEYAYRFGTAYYYAQDGSQQVRQSVAFDTADGSSWWNEHYAQQPDPALNLYLNTRMVKDDLGVFDAVRWTDTPDRQTIRGFDVLKPPEEGQRAGVPYTSNPVDDDAVQFAIRVHNFSLKPTSSPVSVSLYSVPVDSTMTKVTGPKTFIATQSTANPLDAQSYQTVTFDWRAVRPSGVVGNQSYRIFAVVDEASQIAEIHDSAGPGAPCPAASVVNGQPLIDPMTDQLDQHPCGNNNQGFGTVTVSPPSPALDREPVVHLQDESLVLFGADGVPRDGVGTERSVVAEQSVRGGITVHTDAASPKHRDVAIFDGPPSGGKLIQVVRVPGAVVGGTTVPFSWTPPTPGRHVLTAVLLGSHGQGVQRTDNLSVSVSPAPARVLSVARLRPVLLSLQLPDRTRIAMLQTVTRIEQSHRLRRIGETRRHLRTLDRQIQAARGRSLSSAHARALSAGLRLLILNPYRR